MQERLQKIIANAGIASRRKAEELILLGEVTVNGEVISELGSKADPDNDHIKVNGKLINPKIDNLKKVYVLLNKPKGYLSSLSDPENRPLVTALMPKGLPRVYPVGRLDFNTEGLLILTNDGELTRLITSASQHVSKVYEAKVKGEPSTQAIDRLRAGVVIEDRKSAPVQIRKLEISDAGNAWFEIILYEGRNNQIRKMFDLIGHSVVKLRRTRIGHITDNNLPIGKHRLLSQDEVTRFFKKAVQQEKSLSKKVEELDSLEKPPVEKKPKDSNEETRSFGQKSRFRKTNNFGKEDFSNPKNRSRKADFGDKESFGQKNRSRQRELSQQEEQFDRKPKFRRNDDSRPKYNSQRNTDFGDSFKQSDEFRPRRNFGDRQNEDSRPRRNFGDEQNENPRPRRNFGDRQNENPRPRRNFGDEQNENPRPRRNFGDRQNENPRPRRNFGDRQNENPRPRRNFGDRQNENPRPRRNFGDRQNENPRPRRNFGDEQNENPRPRRNFGDRQNENPRPRRNFGDEQNENPRPRRNFGDEQNENPRPRRNFGHKPNFKQTDSFEKSSDFNLNLNDSDLNDDFDFSDEPRPKRNFGNRSYTKPKPNFKAGFKEKGSFEEKGNFQRKSNFGQKNSSKPSNRTPKTSSPNKRSRY